MISPEAVSFGSRKEYINDRDRLSNGLEKLRECNQVVAEMQTQLKELEPVLKERAEATVSLMSTVSKDREAAEKVRAVVSAVEKEVNAMAQETQSIADDAKAELEEALPVLQAAVDSLKALNKNDIVEIKSFPKPPPLVQMTTEAVCILKQEKPDWDTSKKVLSDTNFMKSLVEFDKDNIPDGVIRKLKKYIDDPAYVPDSVGKQSMAAMSLCMWTKAMDTYHRIGKLVQPKKMKLKQYEKALEEANRQLAEKQTALGEVEDRVRNLEEELKRADEEQTRLKSEEALTKTRLKRAKKLASALVDESERWEETVAQINHDMEFLPGDAFLAAACISYLGAFTGPYRDMMVAEWIGICRDKGLAASPNFRLREALSSALEIREWNINGLPTDDVSCDNGVVVKHATRWPLLIDPQGQANSWIKTWAGESGLRIVKQTDPNFLRVLENSIRVGTPTLLEDVGEHLDPYLEPILQKAIFQRGGRTLIRLGDNDVDYDPNFRLYITTKLPNPHYLPDICTKVTLVNFTVTMKGLEDQLLGEVAKRERPDLEEQKDRLVMSIADDKEELSSLEDRILSLLKESKGDILDDEKLINALNNSKIASTFIKDRVKLAEETECSINRTRELYRPVATRGALLYFVVVDLAMLSTMYQYSLKYIVRLFVHCIVSSPQSKDVECRLEHLNSFLTKYLFDDIQRGISEDHKLLFGFLICTAISRNQPFCEISQAEWSFFTGGVTGQGEAIKPRSITWLSQTAWSNAAFLDKNLPEFKGLLQSLRKESSRWQQWMSSDDLLRIHVPGEFSSNMSLFRRLVLIKVLKEDKLVQGISAFVSDTLDRYFVEPEPWSLDSIFPSTKSHLPIIFILSPGADPTSMLQRFASKEGRNVSNRLRFIAMGQGQGRIAELAIVNAAKQGGWICLQNCHVAISWLDKLEKIVEGLDNASDVHPDFRLWLTTMPSVQFPVSVLQNAIKVTTESPKGVKASLIKTYSEFSPAEFDTRPSCQTEWRRLVFAVSFFHSIAIQRLKFGPLGWNIPYDFSLSDLECSLSMIRLHLEQFGKRVSWKAIKYLVGEIHYGGRVTDSWDRRCLNSVLEEYLQPTVLEEDCSFGKYLFPRGDTLEAQRAEIKDLPIGEDPEIFGIHRNAEYALQLREGRRLLAHIASTQPRSSASTPGQNPDATVAATLHSLLESLRPAMNKEDGVSGVFARNQSGELNSLSVVLEQELERFNKLTTTMRDTMRDLEKAIRGQILMAPELESMYSSLLYDEVPELWRRVSYPSNKALASWMEDYHKRVSFIRDWLSNGEPMSFWLSAFFFPQGFLTGVLQKHARAHRVPIDCLRFSVGVSGWRSLEDIEMRPEDGVLVHGLFLEGGQWDTKSGCLRDAEEGSMYSVMPIVHFLPTNSPRCQTEDSYECPLYKTSSRAGTLSTTGLSTNFVDSLALAIDPDTNPSFWIRRGAALLCILD